MPELVTLGELCAVFVAKDIGRMRYCRDFTIRPGGAEATVAVGVKRLGNESGWISAVGNDEMGHYALSLVGGEGVDVSRVHISPKHQTGIFLRERLPGGDARHTYYRQDSAFSHFSPDLLDAEYIKNARILHLTGITAALSPACEATVEEALRIAKEAGVCVTFDPNVRLNLWNREKARPILERFMAAADIVLPGLDDMRMLYGDISREEALLRLKDMGCERIVLKTGDQDVVVFENGHAQFLPIRRIASPVDLMGAGDAFAAGFLAGQLKGRAFADSARIGMEVAGLSIQMPGNIESLPTWAEVERAMNGEKTWNR